MTGRIRCLIGRVVARYASREERNDHAGVDLAEYKVSLAQQHLQEAQQWLMENKCYLDGGHNWPRQHPVADDADPVYCTLCGGSSAEWVYETP